MPIGIAPEAEAETASPLDRLVRESGLSREFVVWYIGMSQFRTAQDLWNAWGDETVDRLKRARQRHGDDFKAWQEKRAKAGPTTEEAAEARAFGVTLADPITEPFAYLGEKLSQQIEIEASIMGMSSQEYLQYLKGGGERPEGGIRLGEKGAWEFASEEQAAAAGGAGAASSATGAIAGEVGEVFKGLTAEELEGLGADEISEKFGLQRLAIEEPEAFLQAMFDKAGIVPSPPIYGFLRDMIPSLVTLASTREGQDLMAEPGGAVQLNRVINEVIQSGFPSRESIMAGLEGLGGFARPFLTGGYEDPRSRFSFVMATLDSLIGPTLSEPLRRTLFSRQAATKLGDRFLSEAARGVFKGDFIDYLRKEGYPIPELPAYEPTPGATAEAAAPFVEEGMATTAGGVPYFPIGGGVYE